MWWDEIKSNNIRIANRKWWKSFAVILWVFCPSNEGKNFLKYNNRDCRLFQAEIDKFKMNIMRIPSSLWTIAVFFMRNRIKSIRQSTEMNFPRLARWKKVRLKRKRFFPSYTWFLLFILIFKYSETLISMCMVDDGRATVKTHSQVQFQQNIYFTFEEFFKWKSNFSKHNLSESVELTMSER